MKKGSHKGRIRVRGHKLYQRVNECSSVISGKKKFVFGAVFVLLIVLLIVYYFTFLSSSSPSNVLVKNTDFHEIEVSWDYSKQVGNYVVIISEKEVTKEDISSDLEDHVIDGNFEVVSVQNKAKVKYYQVLSDTDYYVVVVGYRERGDQREYLDPSNVVKIHTSSLEVSSITDLSAEDIMDTSAKLKWSAWTSNESNLDGTEVEVTYSLYSVDLESGETQLVAEDIVNSFVAVSNLTPFTNYCYQVLVSVKVDGKVISGQKSGNLKFMTMAKAVGGVSAVASGTSSIEISWDAYDKSSFNVVEESEISVTYSVYGSDSEEGEYSLLAEKIVDTMYTDSDLALGKSRYYYVVAMILVNDEEYESVQSGVVTAATEKTAYVSFYSASSSSSSSSSKEA